MALEVEDLGHQVDTHHAVDGGVMHLGDDADVAVLETLDDPQLPQRAAAVERAPGDLGRQLGELVEAAGSRQRGPPDVVVEIEVGILDPHRVMQAERDLDHAPAERLEARESVGDELPHRLDREAAGNVGGVEDHRRHDVHVRRRGFEREEGGVETGQPLHSHSDRRSVRAQRTRAGRGPQGGRRRGTMSGWVGPISP